MRILIIYCTIVPCMHLHTVCQLTLPMEEANVLYYLVKQLINQFYINRLVVCLNCIEFKFHYEH